MKNFLLIILLVIVTPLYALAKEYELYTVSTKVLNERSAPSTNAPIIGHYYKGHNVVVVETQGNWAKTDNQGWVSTKYLEYQGVVPVADNTAPTKAENKTEKKDFFDSIEQSLKGNKFLHKHSDTLLYLMFLFTAATVVLVISDERRKYTWPIAGAYVASVTVSVLYAASSPNRDLTGFFNYIIFCVCAIALLACQVGCFRELLRRLLHRSCFSDSGVLRLNNITLIICVTAALISALCGWFHWNPNAIIIFGGLAVLGFAIYIGTNGFEFENLECTAPAALFYIFGCCATFLVGTVVFLAALPLAALALIIGALGMNSGSSSGATSTSGSSSSSGDEQAYSGPNIHYGKSGHYINSRHFREDTGQDWYRQPDGTWVQY